MNSLAREKIEQFQSLEVAAQEFGHREHVEMAFHMLSEYDFVEATARYASTIRALAEKHGAPEKYNATITFAFVSIIAERMSSESSSEDVGVFFDRNPDLLDKKLLGRWYSDDRLNSALARSQFILPH